MPPTILHMAQMQNQQVGDALVFSEGQAQRRFGLRAGLSVAVYAVDVAVDAVSVTVYAVHSIWDVATYKTTVGSSQQRLHRS